MRFFTFGLAMTGGLASAVPAQGQNALDLTDPTQEEERAEELLPDPPPSDPTILTRERASTAELEGAYRVGSILVTGLSALKAGDFADIVEAYAGRELTGAQLETLTDALARRARDEGYLFATATIPPQALELGVLRVIVSEGRIDEVRLSGVDDPAIRARLMPLVGAPVTMARLERQVLLADDLSGVRIREVRFEREDDRGVLLIETTRERFVGRAEIANDGSRPVGPVRARIDFDANALLLPTDAVDLTFSTNPFEPGELQFAGARYTVTVGEAGTELSVYGSYSATHPGSFLEDRDIFGESTRIGLGVSHPVRRQRDWSVWVEGALELRDLRQDRFGSLVRHDRIPVARIGLYTRADWGENRLRARIEASQGLDIFGATEPNDPLASRDDASAQFTTVYAWADYRRSLVENVSLALAARGQIASAPLLISEDLGLGGSRFLRGYDFSERTGDEGVMGFGELRYDWRDPFGLFRRAQLYTYADGGVVTNLQDGRGGGSLASAGGGVRTDATRDLDLDLEVAVPLTGPRFDTDDVSPRLNVSLSHSF